MTTEKIQSLSTAELRAAYAEASRSRNYLMSTLSGNRSMRYYNSTMAAVRAYDAERGRIQATLTARAEA